MSYLFINISIKYTKSLHFVYTKLFNYLSVFYSQSNIMLANFVIFLLYFVNNHNILLTKFVSRHKIYFRFDCLDLFYKLIVNLKILVDLD